MTLAIIQIARVGEASGFAGMTRPSRISELEPVAFIKLPVDPGPLPAWQAGSSLATGQFGRHVSLSPSPPPGRPSTLAAQRIARNPAYLG